MKSGSALKKYHPSLKKDNIGLKKKYSSLKMDNITVIKLKALAKQRGIKGYYKLRKAELIQKLENHPDVHYYWGLKYPEPQQD